MNSLGRDNNGSKKQKESVFTKETFGVVIVLFATLCLICLISGGAIFSVPGQAVQAFLLGVFGYCAYVLAVWAIIIGVMMIADKSFKVRLKRKLLISALALVIINLIHVITMGEAYKLGYGEYLALSYNMGVGGPATSSFGGILTSIISYVISAVLTPIGCYVVLSVGVALLGYFIVKDFMKHGAKISFNGKKDKSELKGSFVDANVSDGANASASNLPFNAGQVEERDYPVPSATNAMQSKATASHMFVNNKNDFGFKTKRELKNEVKNPAIKLSGGEGLLNVSKPDVSYQNAYSKDMQSKLNYIKTPAKINFENDSKTTIYNGYNSLRETENKTTVSAPIERVEPEKPVVQPLSESNVFDDTASFHAKQFSDKYVTAEELDSVSPVVPSAETNGTFTSTPIEQAGVEIEKMPFERATEIPFIDETGETTSRITVEDITPITSVADSFTEEISQETSTSQESVLGFSDNIEAEKVEASTVESTPVVEETPPTSIVGGSRARRILFGNTENEEKNEEPKPSENAFSKPEQTELAPKPSFTSRVRADSNLGSASGVFSEAKKEEPKKVDKPAPPINREYFRPPLDLLQDYTVPFDAPKEDHERKMEIIKETLSSFRIDVEPKNYVQGPSITRYEIMMPPGISVKKVLSYDDDLRMQLESKHGVRIEAPIPGKNLVGIEVANKIKTSVGLKEIMLDKSKFAKGSLIFALGKDIVGNAITDDLAKGPHYLVAGATGSGKSVCLNVMIVSMIMRYSPEELRLILIDPKGVEFRPYEHIPHLMIDEIITHPKKALAAFQWSVEEMERRYAIFKEHSGVRDIDGYNSIVASATVPKMPRIVLFVDELSNLMETCKKDMEAKILSLAQKARAAGIHLVLATQRPSVDVITGTIKTNLPSRIALKLMNAADSGTIISEGGAEKLLGNGDMLYKNSGMSECERYQGAYLSPGEVDSIVAYIIEKNTAYFDDSLAEYLENAVKPKTEDLPAETGDDGGDGQNAEVSELFLRALALAITSGSISISQLQRRYQIGYPKAGGIFDKMERLKYIAPNEGGKGRRVIITHEEFEEKYGPLSNYLD